MIKIPHVWTIEIDSVARKWQIIKFQRSVNFDPTEFSATIEYSADISYFNTVAIKNNGTTEWAGYVEEIRPAWDRTGRVLEIGGRDLSVILWKKFTERFSDSRTEGFFGATDPAKLIQFLLRCPISDSSIGLPRHKIGWGIQPFAPSLWGLSSSYTDLTTTKNYLISRISGFAWKKGTQPFGPITLAVDGFDMTERDWIPEVGSHPWLDTDDADTSYIEATVVGDNHKYFTFADVSSSYASGTLSAATINIKGKNVIFGGSGANVTIRIYLDVGAGEVNVGDLVWTDAETVYSVKSINVVSTIDTVTKANACKMRIEYSGGTPPDTNYSYPRITYAQLSVNEKAN